MRLMKNWLVSLSVAAAVVCSLLLAQKNRETEQARARVAAVEAEREAVADREAQAEKSSTRLERQLNRSRTKAVETAIEAQRLKQRLARSQAEGSEDKKPGTVLLRDADMRSAFVAEAKEGVEKSVKALFNLGLAQQLQLTEEQTASLRHL